MESEAPAPAATYTYLDGQLNVARPPLAGHMTIANIRPQCVPRPPGIGSHLGRGIAAFACCAALSGCSSPDSPATGAGSGAGATAGTSAGVGSGSGSGSGGTTQGGGPATGQPDVINKAIHRLSNLEYDNTIRDLTGTPLRFGSAFVSEEAEGFDNIATALSMSPRQVEDFFAAAREVSADVFANAALRGRIVTCTPDASTACAEKVMAEFGAKAFRRPLTSEEGARLLKKYQEALALGVDAMGALQHVVHILLASPQFLYRIELDPDLASPAPHKLDGYELASRLSYALWSSMPDDELFGQAASGALVSSSALELEVDRMLADGRSEMLVKNFGARWFGSKRLDDHVASATQFPDYTPALAASMQRELELFFAEFLYEDRPYSELLTADFNFVDGPLAALYGMAAPAQGMERVVNTTDQRVGLLGLAGFLTHTSRETRSSPIIRGNWVLDAILCTPLVLPPGLMVAPLEEPAEGAPPTTVRQQIEAHRAAPTCAGCHNMIDPIGLALETYDAIGRYRTTYENGLPIDATGTLPDGQKVDGLPSLVAALSTSPKFLPCAATKLGTYALGAATSPVNEEQVVAHWLTGAPTLRSLIKATVTHDSFTSRKAEAL
jgi:Protein of unknown function (DUF1592)/Protein of unknown function (DUF1588)/Protein of unknown function (DUF1587)/Protein of unknown function (DUF1595)